MINNKYKIYDDATLMKLNKVELIDIIRLLETEYNRGRQDEINDIIEYIKEHDYIYSEHMMHIMEIMKLRLKEKNNE